MPGPAVDFQHSHAGMNKTLYPESDEPACLQMKSRRFCHLSIASAFSQPLFLSGLDHLPSRSHHHTSIRACRVMKTVNYKPAQFVACCLSWEKVFFLFLFRKDACSSQVRIFRTPFA